MRAAGGGAGVLCAVSIRARHCWRAMPGWWEYVKARARVSIRARHCWRAMRCPACHGFWPAPVSIRARHCWRAMPSSQVSPRVSLTFQSAPAIAGGRCPACAGGARCCSKRFNPRPPLLAGDAAVLEGNPAVDEVSIRARHCWRAMLGR